MAENKKRVSELESSGTNTTGLWCLGVDGEGNSVKIPLGTILAQYNAALGSVTDLNAAAQAAQTAAQTAQSAAETAAGQASAANTAAGNAATTANTADTKATAAKKIAEMARDLSIGFFKEIVDTVSLTDSVCPNTVADINLRGQILFAKGLHRFVCEDNGNYYSQWNDKGEQAYMNSTNTAPLANKLYVDATGQVYYCNDEYVLQPILVDMSSINQALTNLGNAITTGDNNNKNFIIPRLFVNATKLFSIEGNTTLATVMPSVGSRGSGLETHGRVRTVGRSLAAVPPWATVTTSPMMCLWSKVTMTLKRPLRRHGQRASQPLVSS